MPFTVLSGYLAAFSELAIYFSGSISIDPVASFFNCTIESLFSSIKHFLFIFHFLPDLKIQAQALRQLFLSFSKVLKFIELFQKYIKK